MPASARQRVIQPGRFRVGTCSPQRDRIRLCRDSFTAVLHLLHSLQYCCAAQCGDRVCRGCWRFHCRLAFVSTHMPRRNPAKKALLTSPFLIYGTGLYCSLLCCIYCCAALLTHLRGGAALVCQSALSLPTCGDAAQPTTRFIGTGSLCWIRASARHPHISGDRDDSPAACCYSLSVSPPWWPLLTLL